jgi:hypothetical protein
MKEISILFIVSLLLFSCATNPRKVQPVPPTDNIYANYDCKQLEQACNEKANDIRIYAARQESKSRQDKNKMTLNVLVLPIFWWRLGDNENTAKLQAAMGYYEEASTMAKLQKCDFKPKPLNDILREH